MNIYKVAFLAVEAKGVRFESDPFLDYLRSICTREFDGGPLN